LVIARGSKCQQLVVQGWNDLCSAVYFGEAFMRRILHGDNLALARQTGVSTGQQNGAASCARECVYSRVNIAVVPCSDLFKNSHLPDIESGRFRVTTRA